MVQFAEDRQQIGFSCFRASHEHVHAVEMVMRIALQNKRRWENDVTPSDVVLGMRARTARRHRASSNWPVGESKFNVQSYIRSAEI
mgnify:CR=1 FL=1